MKKYGIISYKLKQISKRKRKELQKYQYINEVLY